MDRVGKMLKIFFNSNPDLFQKVQAELRQKLGLSFKDTEKDIPAQPDKN